MRIPITSNLLLISLFSLPVLHVPPKRASRIIKRKPPHPRLYSYTLVDIEFYEKRLLREKVGGLLPPPPPMLRACESRRLLFASD